MVKQCSWIGFLGFFAGFVAATLLLCVLYIAQFSHLNLEIVQILVIAITATFGFGGIFLQNHLNRRDSDFLRRRTIADNILIIKGLLAESEDQLEKLADILGQPLPADREAEEREARIKWLKSSYGAYDVFKVLPFMTNPEPLQGLNEAAIQVCLQYGTNCANVFRILGADSEDYNAQYQELQTGIADCGDKYARAATLLDGQLTDFAEKVRRDVVSLRAQ